MLSTSIKAIIECSHKHLDSYKILFLFKEALKNYVSLYFTTFSMESICHTVASFETTYANLIETIFQSIYKNLLLSYISLPHPKSFKSGGLLNF